MIDSEWDDPLLAQLADEVGFTPTDLKANRHGSLTRRQIARLRWDQRRQYWPSLIAWSVLLALVASLILMHFQAAPALIGLLVGAAILAFWIAFELRDQQHKLAGKGTVAKETVRIDANWKPRRRFSVVEFDVGPRRFAMPHDAAALLQPGHTYRLYYARDVWSFPSAAIQSNRLGSNRSTHRGSYRVLSVEPAPGVRA